MRQNKSYEIYTLMPGRYLPGIFLLFPGSLDYRLLRISENVAKSRPDQFGTQVFIITANDGQAAHSIYETSFTVTVLSVYDPHQSLTGVLNLSDVNNYFHRILRQLT